MDPQATLALGIAGFVIFFVLLYVVFSRLRAKQRATFGGFAERHGLTHVQTRQKYPMVEGMLEGHEFLMGFDALRYAASDRIKRGPSGQTMAQFMVRLQLNDELPDGLWVSKRGLLAKAMTSDVATGDSEFDRQAFIRTADPEATKAYLTPARREALLKLLPLQIELREGCLVYGPGNGKLRGTKVKRMSPEWLEQWAQPFRDTAPILDGGDAPQEAVGRVLASGPERTVAPAPLAPEAAAQLSAHKTAAWWMAGTALVLEYLPALYYGGVEQWISMPLVLTVLFTAAAAFVASIHLQDRIAAAVPRGAAVAVSSFLVGSLAASVFSYWGIRGEFMSWFSMIGFITIGLAAVSGVGLATFVRRRQTSAEEQYSLSGS